MNWKIRVLLASMITGLTTVSYAGGISPSMVPSAVKNTFEQMFPKAVVSEWDYDKDDKGYEVEARQAQAEIKALFTEDGKLIRSKEDVDVEDIPTEILKTVQEQWRRAEVLGANKITTPQGVTWDIALKVRSQYHNVKVNQQ